MLNKKAQVGETVTWVVATIIIIFVLIFFIFGSSMLAETKKIKDFRDSIVSGPSYQGDDLFLKKSIFTYYSMDKDFNRKLIQRTLWDWESQGEFRFSVNDTKLEVYKNLG